MCAASNICRIRDSFCVPCKIFYCNGMTTSREEAQAHADEIQKLTSAKVELHHNDTTSADITFAMGAKLLGGAGLVGYAVGSEKKTSEKKALDTFLGVLGLGLIGYGLYDYCEIQNQKNESAQNLADKAICHLEQNPLSDVTLIFHSQGADIGRRALSLLHHYKDRIHVVTIGGMVDIADGFASRVVNFVDDRDIIAQLAKATFGQISTLSHHGTHTQLATKNKHCKTSACHGASDYLKNPAVKKTIAKFGKSKK